MRSRPALLLLVLLAGCGTRPYGSRAQPLTWPAAAFCTVDVQGKGTKDMETDYLPHVITCENGGADLEALKAQAVSARTYAYYKIAKSGSVQDGTGDQVYTCASQPAQKHKDAVSATSGQVLVYSSTVICAFFVAGGKPSAADCVYAAGDPDPTSTEHYVTYNAGKSGSGITQSTIGWVSPTNKENRGCFSQNGSQCLAQHGKSYPEMLRFYYGDDIQIETAAGPCVIPVGPADQGTTTIGDAAGRADAGARTELARPVDGSTQPRYDWGAAGDGPSAEPGRLSGACSVGPPGIHHLGPLPLLLALALLWRRRRSRT